MGVPVPQQAQQNSGNDRAPSPTAAALPPPALRLRVEAVQTVTPWQAVGEDRVPRRIVAASRDAEALAQRSRVRMVLFYEKAVEDGNGWKLAGKFKESLNIALSEEPVLAGRLRRRAPECGGVGYEVKFTDSGARLVQARAEGPMSTYMQATARGVVDVQRLLTYWKDVNERDIEYSPLFFVQLTVFEGEGFAVGISASLLLADPLVVVNFLRTWSRIHHKMQTSGGFEEESIFHLGNFRRSDFPPQFLDDRVVDSIPDPPTPGNCSHRTLLFRESAKMSGGEGLETLGASSLATTIASHLAGDDVDGETEPFYLFDNQPDGTLLKVDGPYGNGQFLGEQNGSPLASRFLPVSADEAFGGFQEVAFEACRPVHASYAVDSGSGDDVIAVLGGSAVADVNAGGCLRGAAVFSVAAPASVGARA